MAAEEQPQGGLLFLQSLPLGPSRRRDPLGCARQAPDLVGARQEFGKRLRIRLNGIADGGALRGAIAPFAIGDREGTPAIPVVVEYGNRDAACAIELGPRWRVQPHDDLIGAIRSVLHPLAAEVEY